MGHWARSILFLLTPIVTAAMMPHASAQTQPATMAELQPSRQALQLAQVQQQNTNSTAKSAAAGAAVEAMSGNAGTGCGGCSNSRSYAISPRPPPGEDRQQIAWGAPTIATVSSIDVNSAAERAGTSVSRGQTGREVFVSLADRIMIIEEGDNVLASYPIAIGRVDYPTPAGEFRVIDMDDSPTGAPGVSARWLGFLHTGNKEGRVELGIHGTKQTETIGTQASHGCVRLRNQDAIEAFSLLAIGDPIHILSTPFPHLGWDGDISRKWRRIDVAVPAGLRHYTWRHDRHRPR